MKQKRHGLVGLVMLAIAGLVLASQSLVAAQSPIPPPVKSSVGVEGTISSPPPTQPATIATPANGQNFSDIPITVSGICPADTIVKIFSNEIFVGSAVCTNGSYSLQVSLFSGRNDLIARVFDALDQQGPDSAVTTVTYTDALFAQIGSHVIITSQYARRAADPNTSLEWPVVISSGLGPYALSVDWGDGTPSELKSEPFAGTITFRHAYKSPGIYKVTFKVTDQNGTTGYLQVIAVVTGDASTNAAGNTTEKTIVVQKEVLWWPMALLLIPAILSFWLGRRYELTALRRRLEKTYE